MSTPTRAGVHLITGIMAAGKSTVAQALAEQLPSPSVHVRGDTFRKFVVNGRAEMSPDPTPEALAQLELRYRLTAHTCDTYAAAGFTVVAQDVVLGPQLPAVVELIRARPLRVVVLTPRVDVVAAREAGRGKTGYGDWLPAVLDRGMRESTPLIGLWLDTSDLTVEQTVAEILRRGDEALVVG